MRRSSPTVVLGVALALALPAAASALVIQVGNAGTVAPPSCPAYPCDVLSRTTAFQVKDGAVRAPLEIKRSGRIVSWSVTLAAPTSAQISYFDGNENGASSAALAVVRNVRGLSFRLIAQAPVQQLAPLFGSTASFTLSQPIAVRRGDIVALTVPSWAPVLALHYAAGTSWRASRSASQCQNVTAATMQVVVGSRTDYDCLYQTALITYAATEVTSTTSTHR
ncbi:MAG: hypothetical protein ABSG64_05640 [Solirubrobacteraceae bacterium]|jgi:hypothetical protein